MNYQEVEERFKEQIEYGTLKHSALDFKTDASLRHALAAEVKDSAVLIIAQRINTIVNADQIIVLEDGQVVGIGRHDELLEQSGDLMFGDDFDLEKASTPMKTLKRLMHTAKHERLRLTVVLLSVVSYTALTIAAPAYSAGIINLLGGNIQSSRRLGEAFHGGRAGSKSLSCSYRAGEGVLQWSGHRQILQPGGKERPSEA